MTICRQPSQELRKLRAQIGAAKRWGNQNYAQLVEDYERRAREEALRRIQDELARLPGGAA